MKDILTREMSIEQSLYRVVRKRTSDGYASICIHFGRYGKSIELTNREDDLGDMYESVARGLADDLATIAMANCLLP